MAATDLFGFPAACGMCEATGRPLFSVPDDARPTERAPRAVCRICIIRIVGIAPRQRLRVDSGASVRREIPLTETESSPSA